MRLVFGGIVIVAVAIAGYWIVMQRRKAGNTPSLDTVASLLSDVKRQDGAVRGVLNGFTVEFVQKQYRQTMWTELTVATPGAKVLLEMKAEHLGDVPTFVRGAPEAAARTLIGEVQADIIQMHPKSIEITDSQVKLVADRTVRDAADARSFVQLAIDLATRTTGGQAIEIPAAAANEQRQEMRDAQKVDRGKRVVMALIVLVVIGGGLGVFAYKMLQKRKAIAESK